MKNNNQKPQSPSKQSIFQTGSLKNRNQSPMLVPQKQPIKSLDKSLLLDESISNPNQWKQTTEIQIKNVIYYLIKSFQTDSNMKESIEQLVQQITLKLKQQETDSFIKELNSPLLTSDSSAALYQAPLVSEKLNSGSDLFSRICSQEIKKAKALKQFIANSLQSFDQQSVNMSINSSLNNTLQSKNSSKVKQTAGSPSKFQGKQPSTQNECQCVDQKVIVNLQQSLKSQESIIASYYQSLTSFQDQQKKQFNDFQIQVSVQASKILQLDSIITKVETKQQQIPSQQTQQLEKKEKQESSDATSNQEMQKQLQLVMRNLNSLAEHQQQQMMILKTALTTELKNQFLCTSEYSKDQMEIQTNFDLVKEQVKQTQQQSQETLIRKQQMIENLNLEIKSLMNINKEKNSEIEQIKLQNDAMISQMNANKEELVRHNQYIVELFDLTKTLRSND